MKTTPQLLMRSLAVMVSVAAMGVHSSAAAQSYSKTFARSQAQDPGIMVQLCQNDMMVVTTPGVVKAVGVTLPGNVEPQFDGNRVILRGNVTTGRTPVVILMRDNDDIYRMILTGCPTRGASTLIRIVDDSPAPPSAKEYTTAPVATQTADPVTANMQSVPQQTTVQTVNNSAALLNPAASLTGIITLPAPTTVQMDVSRTSTGLTISIANGTAQTLNLRPENLKITAGGQSIPVPANIQANLAPGMTGAYTVPLTADQANADATIDWLVLVNALRAQFNLSSTLK